MGTFIHGNTGGGLAEFRTKFQPIHTYQSYLRVQRSAHQYPKETNMTSKLDVVRTWYDAAWANPPSSIKEANE